MYELIKELVSVMKEILATLQEIAKTKTGGSKK